MDIIYLSAKSCVTGTMVRVEMLGDTVGPRDSVVRYELCPEFCADQAKLMVLRDVLEDVSPDYYSDVTIYTDSEELAYQWNLIMDGEYPEENEEEWEKLIDFFESKFIHSPVFAAEGALSGLMRRELQNQMLSGRSVG